MLSIVLLTVGTIATFSIILSVIIFLGDHQSDN